MAIKITLDHKALTTLIESDPEFVLDLRKAILSNVIKSTVTSRFDDEIRKIIIAETRRYVEECVGHAPSLVSSSRTVNGAISEPMATMIRNAVYERISDKALVIINDAITRQVDRIQAYAEDRIKGAENRLYAHIDSKLDTEVEEHIHDRVKDRIEQVLDALKLMNAPVIGRP